MDDNTNTMVNDLKNKIELLDGDIRRLRKIVQLIHNKDSSASEEVEYDDLLEWMRDINTAKKYTDSYLIETFLGNKTYNTPDRHIIKCKCCVSHGEHKKSGYNNASAPLDHTPDMMEIQLYMAQHYLYGGCIKKILAPLHELERKKLDNFINNYNFNRKTFDKMLLFQ